MTFTATPFTRGDLPQLHAFISANAVARAPVPIYLMTSDVAWRLPGAGAKENLRLWRDASGLAGFVWFEPTTGMEFDLRHDLDYDAAVASDMLAWAEARRGEFGPAYPRFVDLAVDGRVERGNPESARADGRWDGATSRRWRSTKTSARVAFLNANGYRPTQHFMPDYRRDLERVDSARQAAGRHAVAARDRGRPRRTGRRASRVVAAQYVEHGDVSEDSCKRSVRSRARYRSRSGRRFVRGLLHLLGRPDRRRRLVRAGRHAAGMARKRRWPRRHLRRLPALEGERHAEQRESAPRGSMRRRRRCTSRAASCASAPVAPS